LWGVRGVCFDFFGVFGGLGGGMVWGGGGFGFEWGEVVGA